jgi:hypothetical protein
MTSCPLYNSSNLDSTGNKMNNPYALIQKGGILKRNNKKKTNKRNVKNKNKNKRKTKRVRFHL